MPLNKAPIVAQKIADNELQLLLFMEPSLAYFQGHFPDFPILPGVAQIDWAIYYGQTLLNCPNKFAGMEVIKFQEAILPNQTVSLTLKWQSDKGMLYFSFNSHGVQPVKTHSSGRIKLVNAA
ncbi:3-hydroxyacyl-ACP dehydratase [Psychromonas sp. MME2]|uniref:ApeI family dehydratase n=1 Tax=unclassified Psychromonas TaxID=2614957 RepID=UPI00339C4BC8